jgi:apolipoprotein N-acyltransferase
MLVLVMVIVGIAGYEGITCALVFLGFCLCVCRRLSRSSAFVCVSLARLVFLCLSFSFRRRPTGMGRAAFCFFGRGVVLADASI